ncbi:hypothetical protein QUC31_009026 [Theobroma cacao]
MGSDSDSVILGNSQAQTGSKRSENYGSVPPHKSFPILLLTGYWSHLFSLPTSTAAYKSTSNPLLLFVVTSSETLSVSLATGYSAPSSSSTTRRRKKERAFLFPLFLSLRGSPVPLQECL